MWWVGLKEIILVQWKGNRYLRVKEITSTYFPKSLSPSVNKDDTCSPRLKNNFILHQLLKITNTYCQLFIDEMIYTIYITFIGYIMIKHYINYIDTLAHPMTLLRF